MISKRVSYPKPDHCPQCGSSAVIEHKDKWAHWWLCLTCGARQPLDWLEVKND